MGRTPDYKASFMATLGADPDWYAPFADSGRHWYRAYAERALFLNHVLINPPIDRDKAVHEVEDVYVHVVRERDDGIVVSGAKMLATGSAITNATFVAQNSAVHLEKGKAEDYALVFIAPMDTPGRNSCAGARTRPTPVRPGRTRCRAASTRTTRSSSSTTRSSPGRTSSSIATSTRRRASTPRRGSCRATRCSRGRGWR
jgi:aromatic ring hydroxylase